MENKIVRDPTGSYAPYEVFPSNVTKAVRLLSEKNKDYISPLKREFKVERLLTPYIFDNMLLTVPREGTFEPYTVVKTIYEHIYLYPKGFVVFNLTGFSGFRKSFLYRLEEKKNESTNQPN